MQLRISKKKLTPYLFIAPSIVILLVFSIIPIFISAYLAMVDFKVINPAASEFVGLANFRKLFHDPFVREALLNTFQYSLTSVIPGLALSLAFALIVTEDWFRLQKLFRAVTFIPYILSMTICAMVWSWLYSPTLGLFNYVLSALGLPTQKFLGDPRTAMNCIVVMVIWKGLGYNVTIWSAGLLSLPMEHREAARIDGANWMQEFWYVRLPQLKPVMIFLTVLGFIGSFQSFDAIYMMTNGGPMRSTQVIVYYLWKTAFEDLKMGYASAIAWLLFIILISLTAIQFRLYGRKED